MEVTENTGIKDPAIVLHSEYVSPLNGSAKIPNNISIFVLQGEKGLNPREMRTIGRVFADCYGTQRLEEHGINVPLYNITAFEDDFDRLKVSQRRDLEREVGFGRAKKLVLQYAMEIAREGQKKLEGAVIINDTDLGNREEQTS